MEVPLAELELAGCDENFVRALPTVSEADSPEARIRKCSVKAPVLLPIMKRANCAEARRKMLDASQRRCMEKNGPSPVFVP